MGDNNSLACPIQSFSSSDFPSANTNSFNADSPNRANKSLGEFLQEPLNSPYVDGFSSGKEVLNKSPAKEAKDNTAMDVDTAQSQISQGNSEPTKFPEDSVSQDLFENNKESSNEKVDESNSNEGAEYTEGFDLHLSETQAFLPSAEKQTDKKVVNDSEESEEMGIGENEKDKAGDKAEDVEMSNGSCSNQGDGPGEDSQPPASTAALPEPGKPKAEGEEALSNGELSLTKDGVDGTAEEDEEEEGKKTDEGDDGAEKSDDAASESNLDNKESEDKEAMEVVDSTNEAALESEESSTCTCEPACHRRIKKVSEHLVSACSQLDDFIKLKRREENKLLKNFLEMLNEIKSVSQNSEIEGDTKITNHALIPEDTAGKRKGSKRKSSDMDTPLKEAPRKKVAQEKKKEEEKMSEVDFKDLKGLAVFAKWPNSGWYYPGKVEELSESDWKDANNVTVKFYDGLVREMKNINILPAHLIPVGSILCDLEDETEMVVVSCDGSNQNSVDFKLSTKDTSDEVELNFNKLAIKAIYMKTIKQQLEPTTDVVPKKMHMVSLDNLVSGRRSRVRPKRDDSDTEEKTPIQSERRSRSSTSSTPAKKPATPRRTRN